MRDRSQALLSLLFVSSVALAGCGSSDAVSDTDIQAEIDQALATVPLPPGASFSPIELDPTGTYQAGSGTNMVQFQAVCGWFSFWAQAIADQDHAAIELASTTADDIRTWETYTTSDTSLREYWDQIIEEARLGDPTGLAEMHENNCG